MLAPSKPRRDDVRRFCLPCSAETGRMVERTCPSLDKKREQRRVSRSEQDKKKRATAKRKAEAEAKARHEREESRWFVEGHDIREEFVRLTRFTRVWASIRGKPTLMRWWKGWTLTTSYRSKGTRSQSGYCNVYGRQINISVSDHSNWACVRETLLHEMVHAVLPPEENHGDRFRYGLAQAAHGVGYVPEGTVIPVSGATHKADNLIEQCLMDMDK